MKCNYLTEFCKVLMLNEIYKGQSISHDETTLVSPHTNPLSSCNDAQQDGVYLIQIPKLSVKPFYALCLFEYHDNRPWTIVQRGMDGSQYFYRKWQDYKHGFGNLYREFFIGLDALHALTYSQPHELWIQLMNTDGEKRTANYTHFAVGDESTKYMLNVLGEYSGNAGDSLTHHAGRKFTTKDQNNNDEFSEDCAFLSNGAWWYRKCHRSNLNGVYGLNYRDKGIIWYDWTGDSHSLKYVHMAIRPRKSSRH